MNPALSASSAGAQARFLPNPPTFIECAPMLRFLIMDAPSDRNLELYRAEMARHNVTDVVRACDPTYDKTVLETAGIHVHDWPFADGEAPPESIVLDWLRLVEDRLVIPYMNRGAAEAPRPCIAVHCVAGLGRAPLLVAMALIEYANMQPLDSVIYIRERRRGAINARQLRYIERYKRGARRKGLAQRAAAAAAIAAGGDPGAAGRPRGEKCLVM